MTNNIDKPIQNPINSYIVESNILMIELKNLLFVALADDDEILITHYMRKIDELRTYLDEMDITY